MTEPLVLAWHGIERSANLDMEAEICWKLTPEFCFGAQSGDAAEKSEHEKLSSSMLVISENRVLATYLLRRVYHAPLILLDNAEDKLIKFKGAL